MASGRAERLGLAVAARARDVVSRVSRATPMFRGKRRLARLVERGLRAAAPAAGPVEARVAGVTLSMDPREEIQFRMLYFGVHDGEVLTTLRRELTGPAPVLWDVGANMGALTLPLAAAVPGLRVEAFEPSPSVRARLARNVGLNAGLAGRVRVHGVALTDREGEGAFFESAEAANAGLGSLAAMSNTRGEGVKVPLVTGDALLASGAVARPTAIKIDVEGFEREVLEGISGLLEGEAPPVLVIEHSPYRLTERGVPFDAVFAWLRERGFTLARLDARGDERPFGRSEERDHFDFTARRRG